MKVSGGQKAERGNEIEDRKRHEEEGVNNECV